MICRASLVSLLLITCAVSANEPLRKAGDILQFASPIFCLHSSYNDNKTVHFVSHYLQAMLIVGTGKWSGKKLEYKLAQRPDKTAYTGMPSGHTASVWLPASYMRHYGGRRYITYTLYGAACLTAYSRIKSKRHTPLQVLASVALCEMVTTINKKYLQHLYINDNEIGVRLRL